MVIALFGRSVSADNLVYVQRVVDKLMRKNCRLVVYHPFFDMMKERIDFSGDIALFSNGGEIAGKVDYFISIGGDGTILDALTLVRDSGIPVMGINIGRLGFLSSISKDEILPAIDRLLNRDFTIEPRVLVRLSKPEQLFGDMNYALNEFTITRKDTTSLIKLHVYVNDMFLNSYWADGLIIATPTGSTAYSLSTGGPIMIPGSENFVITPIAPHNLTVRPVVIPDKSKIRIIIDDREEQYLVSLDSRRAPILSNLELYIEKADFKFNIIQMKDRNFFMTIREKLKWGLDARN
ncbi:MAG: NAD kinase [Bacteroidales bacterium]|nr:NAD kinase [Bacteroidales bacterium]